MLQAEFKPKAFSSDERQLAASGNTLDHSAIRKVPSYLGLE